MTSSTARVTSLHVSDGGVPKLPIARAQVTRTASMEVAITQDSLAWTADGVRLPAMRRCSF